MSRSEDQSPVPQRGSSITPLVHQEARYRAAPTWTRALLWAMVGTVGWDCLRLRARIDEVVTATGELQALGAERPVSARAWVLNNPVKEGAVEKEQVLPSSTRGQQPAPALTEEQERWRSADSRTDLIFKAREEPDSQTREPKYHCQHRAGNPQTCRHFGRARRHFNVQFLQQKTVCRSCNRPDRGEPPGGARKH